jgi:long-chain acyl-CoA synthetase
MNLFASLEATAARFPEKAALIEDEAVVSYAELLRQTQDWAEKIRQQGVTPGRRIGLAFPNSIAYVALTYALWRCGAIVVPIPTECSPDEITEIIGAMELQGLVTQAARPGAVALASNCFFVALQPTNSPDNHGLNLAFIRFTSGTTSARKGVALSHETIRARVRSANQAFGITDEDTVIWCLPMAHHFLITIVLYLEVGATIVLARHVTAKPFLDAVQRWRGTVLYAAPFHYAMLARDRTEAQLTSVRLAVSTTCALPQTVAADFYRRFQRPLAQALGVIELGLVAVNIAAAQTKWNSVGKAAGEFELRLDQPDAAGCGELAVRGPGICDAYVAPWLPREQMLRDGWFYTGDLGKFDADGDLFLLSRKTAVINLAGRKVFPEEIETVINLHSDVVESRVYGRPHPHLGEVVEAEIVLRADGNLDAVRSYCRDHLAAYKIPTRFTGVPALPKTPVTGKLLRSANVV